MTHQPVILALTAVSFETAAAALASDRDFACIDARHAAAPDNRYSIIASDPAHTFSLAGGFVTIDDHTVIESPMTALERFSGHLNECAHDPYLPFNGGIIGYVGFEGARAIRGFEPAAGYSRYPQCRFGLYRTAVFFDHLEGTSWIVSNKSDSKKAHILLDRLLNAPKWKSPEGRYGQLPFTTEGLRMTPDEGTLHRLLNEAYNWLQAETLSHIHLAQHVAHPTPALSPIDDFLMGGIDGMVRAMFTYQGTNFILSSCDALLDIRGDAVRSHLALDSAGRAQITADIWTEHKKELLRICTSNSLKTTATGRTEDGQRKSVTFKGQKRQEMKPIDGLFGLIPSAALTGYPRHLAIQFITKNEKSHRTFHGGAFGTIDPFRLTFRTIQQSAIHADGMVRQTLGINMTAATDLKTTLGGMRNNPPS